MTWEMILADIKAREMEARERELSQRAAYEQSREVDRLEARLGAARGRNGAFSPTAARVN